MNQEQWRRSMDQHRQQHQQMADQQRASWKRMNDDWDRQARAAAARTSGGEPATLGDRVGLIAGAVVLVLVVAGSVFAWVQLREGDGDAASSSQGRTDTEPGAGQQPGTGGGGTGDTGDTGGTDEESEPAPGSGIVVPLLRGESGADAAEVLDGLGLEAAFLYGDGEELCDDDSIANNVVALEPAAGTEVEPGTTVTVKVTRHDSDGTVAVPDLTGESVTQAREHLEGAGLALADPVPPDEVLVGWQDADECKRLPVGFGVVVAEAAP